MPQDQYIEVQKEDSQKLDVDTLEQMPKQKQKIWKPLDLLLLLIVIGAVLWRYHEINNRELQIQNKKENFIVNLQKAKSILKIQENQCNFRDGLLAKPFIVEEIKKEEEVPEVPKPSEERVQEVLQNARKQLEERQKQINNNVVKENDYEESKDGNLGVVKVAGIDVSMVRKAQQYQKLKDLGKDHPLADQQRRYYENKYNISQYDELPFCLVVPTYNNENNERYKHNLDSIFQQQYHNYHVVVIEDASKDKTGILIDQYVAEHEIGNKIKVIHNNEQNKALPNIRRAAFQFCQEQQIMMIVDGDDELIGRQILKHFNSVFQERKVWFMYTNFVSPHGTIGYSRPFKKSTIQKNEYRRVAFMTSHLRAFYTRLLRLVKDQDLKDQQGEFFRAANDVAICLPILEMAHEKVAYVPQISYLYNSNTGNNNHRVRLREQAGNNKKIRKFQKYQPLQSLF